MARYDLLYNENTCENKLTSVLVCRHVSNHVHIRGLIPIYVYFRSDLASHLLGMYSTLRLQNTLWMELEIVSSNLLKWTQSRGQT